MTRPEPIHTSDFADELGGADRGDAVDLAQMRGNCGGSLVEFDLESVISIVSDLIRSDQVCGDPGDRGLQSLRCGLGFWRRCFIVVRARSFGAQAGSMSCRCQRAG